MIHHLSKFLKIVSLWNSKLISKHQMFNLPYHVITIFYYFLFYIDTGSDVQTVNHLIYIKIIFFLLTSKEGKAYVNSKGKLNDHVSYFWEVFITNVFMLKKLSIYYLVVYFLLINTNIKFLSSNFLKYHFPIYIHLLQCVSLISPVQV